MTNLFIPKAKLRATTEHLFGIGDLHSFSHFILPTIEMQVVFIPIVKIKKLEEAE